MKLIVFCLLTICWGSLVSTTPPDMTRRKLKEILHDLKVFQEDFQHKELMVNTPPENIEGCSCRPALTCYLENLKNQFNIPNKLYRNIRRQMTQKNAQIFCNPNNTMSTNENCTSHPEEKAEVFFDRLKSLIQKGIAGLSMK